MTTSKITDRALLELLIRTTPGEWALASDEDIRFYIYARDTSPIKYVMREIHENTSNYDLRLMALAKDLAAEVLELRKVVRGFKEFL